MEIENLSLLESKSIVTLSDSPRSHVIPLFEITVISSALSSIESNRAVENVSELKRRGRTINFMGFKSFFFFFFNSAVEDEKWYMRVIHFIYRSRAGLFNIIVPFSMLKLKWLIYKIHNIHNFNRHVFLSNAKLLLI